MIKIGNCLINKNEILYIKYKYKFACDISAKLCVHFKSGEELFLNNKINDIEFLESKGEQ